jgi:hypothetical protein
VSLTLGWGGRHSKCLCRRQTSPPRPVKIFHILPPQRLALFRRLALLLLHWLPPHGRWNRWHSSAVLYTRPALDWNIVVRPWGGSRFGGGANRQWLWRDERCFEEGNDLWWWSSGTAPVCDRTTWKMTRGVGEIVVLRSQLIRNHFICHNWRRWADWSWGDHEPQEDLGGVF